MKWTDFLKRKIQFTSQELAATTESSLDTLIPIVETSKPEDTVQFLTFLNQFGLAMWSFDLTKQNEICISEKAREIIEVPTSTITYDFLMKIVHKDDLERVKQMLKRLEKEQRVTFSFRIVTPNHRVKLLKDTLIAFKDHTGNISRIIALIEEQTQSYQLEQQLDHLKFFDELTNLPNYIYKRKFLNEFIEESKQKKKRFALFYINLDGFDHFKDILGFKIGDEIITKITRKLKNILNPYGFLFRSQGDNEWCAVIDQVKKEKEYHIIAKQILDVIKDPLLIQEYEIKITASVGVGIYPCDADNKVDLMKNAHMALRRARNFGPGNYQMYSTSMNIESFKYFQLETDLRHAIENNELYLEFQPKIDIKTQRATSAEALLRWHHPAWGLVSPAEFIPISEGSLIHEEITDFVIENTIKQVGEWEKQGVPFQSVSFNLSAKDFLRPSLVDQIKKTIRKYKVSPALLEIELTEGTMLQNSEIVQQNVVGLRDFGTQLSLDDFGTGYSSVQYLKDLPVNTVKIDRSFIQHLSQNRQDYVIVESMIYLSKGLKKKVVAEGVETVEQFKILKELGCDEIQGFYFSKSISDEEMKQWFQMEKVHPKVETYEPKVNRRKYFRVQFFLSLSAKMTILTFNHKNVSLGTTEVLIKNMGLGGLCFLSHLRLVPKNDIVYGFETEVLGSSIKLSGKIIWFKEKDKGIFEYGVAFTISERERDNLAPILNRLALKLRSNPNFKEGNFLPENPDSYLKRKYIC